LFVLADYAKTAEPMSTKFGEKVAHGPFIDFIGFIGNPDCVTSGKCLGGAPTWNYMIVLLRICYIVTIL